MPACQELEAAFLEAWADPAFRLDLRNILDDYAGRPSILTECHNLGRQLGIRLLLKREDLNHTGSHKINNVLGQTLLAKRMGKTRIVAETGAGQHGVASATAAALMGLECKVYMGAVDVERQALNVFRMRLLGAEVEAVESGSRTLKDAVNEAMRDWVATVGHSALLPRFGDGAASVSVDGAPVPPGDRRRGARAVPRRCSAATPTSSSRASAADRTRWASSPASSTATPGLSASNRPGGAAVSRGNPGVVHGMRSYLMQDEVGQVEEAQSISAGLDYPGVGPEHSYLASIGRAEYPCVTDAEVIDAFQLMARSEGIIPALESAHALAWIARESASLQGQTVLMNLSGRGDKDVAQMMDIIGMDVIGEPTALGGRSAGGRVPGQARRRSQAARAVHHRWLSRAGRTRSGRPPPNGADAIEIGIPFSDPVMDGPVIQQASQAALDAGAVPAAILDEVPGLDVDIPLARDDVLQPRAPCRRSSGSPPTCDAPASARRSCPTSRSRSPVRGARRPTRRASRRSCSPHRRRPTRACRWWPLGAAASSTRSACSG